MTVIHSFNKYWLNNYYVSPTLLGAGNTEVNKTDKNLCLGRVYSLAEREVTNNNIINEQIYGMLEGDVYYGGTKQSKVRDLRYTWSFANSNGLGREVC